MVPTLPRVFNHHEQPRITAISRITRRSEDSPKLCLPSRGIGPANALRQGQAWKSGIAFHARSRSLTVYSRKQIANFRGSSSRGVEWGKIKRRGGRSSHDDTVVSRFCLEAPVSSRQVEKPGERGCAYHVAPRARFRFPWSFAGENDAPTSVPNESGGLLNLRPRRAAWGFHFRPRRPVCRGI